MSMSGVFSSNSHHTSLVFQYSPLLKICQHPRDGFQSIKRLFSFSKNNLHSDPILCEKVSVSTDVVFHSTLLNLFRRNTALALQSFFFLNSRIFSSILDLNRPCFSITKSIYFVLNRTSAYQMTVVRKISLLTNDLGS